MSKNGILRRVDELGRIVIPINIRKALDIYENDLVEVYLSNDDEIKIKRHSTINDKNEMYNKICISIFNVIGGTIMVCDENNIIASYGDKRFSYKPGNRISNEMIINGNKEFHVNKENCIVNDYVENENNVMVSIKDSFGKTKGYIIYIYQGSLLENNRALLSSYAIFISEMMR